jgi:exopolyphosphatase/pppGpp-phosphohydrolase
MESQSKQKRIEVFRDKIKQMSKEELLALVAIMERRTDDLAEELAVLKETLAIGKLRQMKWQRLRG